VLELAVAPGHAGFHFGIGAREHDAGDPKPKLGGDAVEHVRPVILDPVVQKRRDRFVLTPAVFEDKRRHGLKVGEIRDLRATPALAGMEEFRVH
jgi:hypothetical protein